MDSPVRKQLKRNDYLRHKMFRKINRRRKAERLLAIDAPAKELRRRLRRRTFKCGKDAYLDGKDGGNILMRPGGSEKEVVGDNTNQYSVGNLVDAIYQNNPREEFLGEPSHHYDFTQSEEWADAHGYFPDARGHRDDRVKKPAHPSHPSRGRWDGDKFILTDLGMQNPNYTLFGLVDGDQDPQATLVYNNGVVLPEITVTPKGNFFYNPYDNIELYYASGKDSGIHIKPENRGKFTRLKKRTGKSASWFKAHGTPAQKKMAVFALNSRKWSHKK